MLVPKEIVHNAVMAIPMVRRWAQRWHSHGRNYNKEVVRKRFEYLQAAAPVGGRDVAELGPGRILQMLRSALEAGACSCTALEVFDYFEDVSEKDLRGVELVVYPGRRIPLPDRSKDILWSFDVFEHVRHPKITLDECARILRPGGVMICEIDLRDHYQRDESKLADHLRYSSWLWNAMTWNRSAFTNRLRHSDWLKLFDAAGFKVRSCVPNFSEVLRREYEKRQDLRIFSLDDVAITSFRAVLER